MEIFGLLLAPVALIGFIWLLIIGFKKSLGWGFWLFAGPMLVFMLAVLFIKPSGMLSILLLSALGYLPAISFAYKNWEDARKAFLVYIIPSVLSLLVSVNTLSSISNNNLELLIDQAQQGKLNPEDAARKIREAIQNMDINSSLSEQDMLVMKTAKNIVTRVEANLASDPDYYDKEANKEYQRDLAKIEAQRKRDAAKKNLENMLNQRKIEENKPKAKKATVYPKIKKSEIKKYIGSNVIILTTQNVKHHALLKGFDDETYRIILEKEHKSGKLLFKVHMSDVKTIFLYVEE